MNRSDLIDSIALKTGLTKKDSEAALNAALETISQALAEGEKVQLMDFGGFSVKERAGRTARNPRTNEIVQVPPRRTVDFKPGKALKERVEN